MERRRSFDRILHFDPRSRGYLIRDLLTAVPLVTQMWNVNVKLDQGQEGACVGFGWTQWAASDPEDDKEKSGALLTNDDAFALYHRAQQIDHAPPGTEGASVLAGAKATAELGRVQSYHWATTVDEVAQAICQVGPVVIGVDWFQSMFKPTSHYYLRVSRTAQPVGGHCTLLSGYDKKNNRFRLHNSWGASWGQQGEAWLSARSLDYLLVVRKGEACLPLKA